LNGRVAEKYEYNAPEMKLNANPDPDRACMTGIDRRAFILRAFSVEVTDGTSWSLWITFSVLFLRLLGRDFVVSVLSAQKRCIYREGELTSSRNKYANKSVETARREEIMHGKT
jgi:hypothetical protein